MVNEKLKKNFPLLVGLALPVLMILFVAASIYIPPMFSRPRYDFLYTTGGDYYGHYGVQGEKVVKNTVEYPAQYVGLKSEGTLHVYDVEKNESRSVTFEEAHNLALNGGPQSPDGYEIVLGGYGGDVFPFFFSSGDYGNVYIKARAGGKKLNIARDPGNFRFLGWMKEPSHGQK